MINVGPESKHLLLGIDGGATKTQWTLCVRNGDALLPVREGTAGPASMALLGPEALRRVLAELPPEATHVGVFLAGCATDADRQALETLAREIWPQAAIRAGSDRECGFAAAFGTKGDGITVIAGTGSAVTGRRQGQEERAGGWGHLLGDTGGGYDLAIRALRRVLFDFDTGHRVSALARDILQALDLRSLRELSAWAQTARKHDLAQLTPIVFAHAGTAAAREILQDGAAKLAALTHAVAGRLRENAPSIRLMGGVFLRQPRYAALFAGAMHQLRPGADVAVCGAPASHGAALLAEEAPPAPAQERTFHEPALREAVTEHANPRSAHLDQMATRDLVELFVREERSVESALAAAAEPLTEAIELAVRALRRGGRLIYVGAGTSGRLGILDASEMPPTFGTPPDWVQAVIAGGPEAIRRSIEGAEDDAAAGGRAVAELGAGPDDVVCGITASGRTPYVCGAIRAALERRAGTILLTCNPARDRGLMAPSIAIDLATGPELITGSTRLKAGTATKIALNILSSCTMIRLGRVTGNFMSHLRPTNQKLRDRAVRFVAQYLQMDENHARERLACANWNIPAAIKPPASPGDRDSNCKNS